METWDDVLNRVFGTVGEDVEAVSVVDHDGEYRIGLVTLEGLVIGVSVEHDSRTARAATFALAAIFRVRWIRVYRDAPCGNGCIRQLQAAYEPGEVVR